MTAAVPVAFFSYSRQDSDFVLKLARDLRERGAAVWLDQLDSEPGERWDRAVEPALARSPRVLLVLSPASVDSTNVMDEVSFALEEHKLVIPVLYRACKIPFRLRRVQYIDARTDYQRALDELLEMLGPEVVGQVGTTAAGTAMRPVVHSAAPSQLAEKGLADDAGMVRQLEDDVLKAVEPREARRPVGSDEAVQPARSKSRRTFILAGLALTLLLGGAIAVWMIPRPMPSPVPPAPAPAPEGSTSVELMNQSSGKCLSVKDASKAHGATLMHKECGTGNPDAIWEMRPRDPGYRVVNRNSGFCLGVAHQSKKDGEEVTQVTPCDRADTIWKVENAPPNQSQRPDPLTPPVDYGKTVVIRNNNSDKCLALAAGDRIKQYGCPPHRARTTWTFVKPPNAPTASKPEPLLARPGGRSSRSSGSAPL